MPFAKVLTNFHECKTTMIGDKFYLNIEQEFLEVINKLSDIATNQSKLDDTNGVNKSIDYGVIISSDGNVKTVKTKYSYSVVKRKSSFSAEIVVNENERYKYILHYHFLPCKEKSLCRSKLEQIYSHKEQRVIYSKLVSDVYDAENKTEAIKNELGE